MYEKPPKKRVCTIGKIGIDGIDGLYVHSVIRGVMCGGELGSVLTNHRLPPKYAGTTAGTTAPHCRDTCSVQVYYDCSCLLWTSETDFTSDCFVTASLKNLKICVTFSRGSAKLGEAH